MSETGEGRNEGKKQGRFSKFKSFFRKEKPIDPEEAAYKERLRRDREEMHREAEEARKRAFEYEWNQMQEKYKREAAMKGPQLTKLENDLSVALKKAQEVKSDDNWKKWREAKNRLDKYRDNFGKIPEDELAKLIEPQKESIQAVELKDFKPVFNKERLTDENAPIFDRVGEVLDACAGDEVTEKFTEAGKGNMSAYLEEWKKYLNNPDRQQSFMYSLRRGDISDMVEEAFRRPGVAPWVTREVTGPRVFGMHQDGHRQLNPCLTVLGAISEQTPGRSIHDAPATKYPSVELATNLLKGLGVLEDHQTYKDISLFTNVNQVEAWKNVDNPNIDEAARKKYQTELSVSMKLQLANDFNRGRGPNRVTGPIPTAIPGVTVLVHENLGPNHDKDAGEIEIAMDEDVFIKQLQPFAPKIT